MNINICIYVHYIRVYMYHVYIMRIYNMYVGFATISNDFNSIRLHCISSGTCFDPGAVLANASSRMSSIDSPLALRAELIVSLETCVKTINKDIVNQTREL